MTDTPSTAAEPQGKTPLSSSQDRHWFAKAIAPYKRPEMAAMLLLGFASGLPLYLVYQKTSFWLRLEGIDRSTIGFFYWVGMAYSFKFLWAPIIDKLTLPYLTKRVGHRRSWMIVSIMGTMAGLFLIASGTPSESLVNITIGAIVLAFSGATLDVSIDAWRIESAPSERQANMAASYSLGYRGALIFSGLGFVIADFSNWNLSFVVMGLTMGLCAGLILLISEPPRAAKIVITSQDKLSTRLYKLFGEPFTQVAARFGWLLLPILLLVMIYRLSDFTMGVMASPLYADLGYAPAVVGGIQSGPGVAAIIVGLFLGGAAAQRFGIMPSLVIGALITFLTNGAYAWFASVATGEDPWMLTFAICADNVAGGFVTTVFIAYLSSLVDPAQAATQYALFSSLYATLNKFVAGFSGVMADALGYVNFFLVTASYALPAAGLVILVAWLQTRHPPKPLPGE
ncbi:MAG: MFS transporter [Pseudomonadota bacterium]